MALTSGSAASQRTPDPQGMSDLIRGFPWAETAISTPLEWSPALHVLLEVMLANRFPLLLWWGPQYISIYNDAYVPILGQKHPWALGKPVRECWSEIWDVLQPLIDTPFHGGPATWLEDIELQINRSGFSEETHFTVAYSAVPDETAAGGIGGVLATVHEITAKVIGERRTTILRDLGARGEQPKTPAEACQAAAATLARHPKDVPYALLYLISGTEAHEAASCGLAGPRAVGPPPWAWQEACRSGELQRIREPGACLGAASPGPWPEPPREAVLVPIRSNSGQSAAGFLVAGISSHLRFDEAYRGFLELAADQIASAVANASAYDEERRRAEALAQIDRAKTVFFSNVSHEFRTPLTLMLGPLERLLEGELPPELREPLAVAHRNGLRLLKLVNSLLEFSRLEAGRLEASFTPTDLAAFTAELASNFRAAIENAGLRFEVRCPPLAQPVYVDREMWEKVVLNLLSNAFKFTFSGSVVVSLEARGEEAVLTVSDTGTGIPEPELPRIFERFHRVEGANGRTYEGTGIGLALVHEFVKLHGGRVEAVSREGSGSGFTVAVPFGHAHLNPGRVRQEGGDAAQAIRAHAFASEALGWLERPRSAPGGAAADSAGTERPRILVADDNADMRDHIASVLGPGYEVVAAGDGEAALREARAKRPDLVLTDVMMPRLDGVGLLRALRADRQLRNVPVILLSARAGDEARTDGIAARADDYLIKPFAGRELAARVQTLLSLQHLRSEAQAQFEALLNRAPLGVYLVDGDFRIRHVNPTAAPVFGDLGEIVGRNFDEVAHMRWPAAYAEEVVRCFRHTLATGESHVTAERVETRHDRTAREVYEWRIDRVPMPEGGHGVVCYFRDITLQVGVRDELRRANRDLEQFAYTASHDLQEPLRGVRIFSELLAAQGGDRLDAECREYLDYVRGGATWKR